MARARKVPTAGRSSLAWLAPFVLPLVAAAALIAGVIWLGRLARDSNLRFGSIVTFADIECQPPPGMTREEFLAEARGEGEDELTQQSIRRRLSAHPWVAHVEKVRVQPDRIEADLVYRVPVLWVGSRECAVDRHGVLLPPSAKRSGLLVYTSKTTTIPDSSGVKWDDAGVIAAAKLAGELANVAEVGRLTLESDGELVLWDGARRYLWGKPPGEEVPPEPSASIKIERLRKALKAGEDADLRR